MKACERTCNGTLMPVLGLLLAMLIWGSSFIAMKIALTTCHPLLVLFGRMFVAASIFLLFRKRFGSMEYRRGDWKLLAFMAVCEPCLYFTFEVYALNFTSASEAGMVTAMLPLMAAFTARFALAEKLSFRTLAGFAIALAGVIGLTAFGRPNVNAPYPVLGNFLEFMAMVCATGYTITSRYLSSRYSPFFLTAIQAFAGSLFFMPVLFLPSTDLSAQFAWHTSLSILYLGAAVSVVAYFLYNYGLSRIPVNQVSCYVNLIPVFCLLFGWLVLGERLTPVQYIAVGLVFLGTLTSQEHGRILFRKLMPFAAFGE